MPKVADRYKAFIFFVLIIRFVWPARPPSGQPDRGTNGYCEKRGGWRTRLQPRGSAAQNARSAAFYRAFCGLLAAACATAFRAQPGTAAPKNVKGRVRFVGRTASARVRRRTRRWYAAAELDSILTGMLAQPYRWTVGVEKDGPLYFRFVSPSHSSILNGEKRYRSRKGRPEKLAVSRSVILIDMVILSL